ncbi:MAG: chromosome condensation regulator RCC1 [Polyangiaceae bacterium]|nr:chromosome condensation regulator RCC1 [Polyangiaceae bacterium]
MLERSTARLRFRFFVAGSVLTMLVASAACGDDGASDGTNEGGTGGGGAQDGGGAGGTAEGGTGEGGSSEGGTNQGGTGAGGDVTGGGGEGGGPSVPDTVAPNLTVTGLEDGVLLRTARMRFEAAASDDVELARFGYVLNGQSETEIPIEQGMPSSTSVLDLRPTRGNNTLVVFAEDAAGNRTEVPLSARLTRSTAAGGAHTGVVANGQVIVWGRNNLTQLGLGPGDTTSRTTPVVVPGLSSITAIELRQNQSLALAQDGTLYGWGNNADGRLGLGAPGTPDTSNRDTPTPIAAFAGVLQVASGYDHTLVLREDGTVWSFGDNSMGQLGDGTTDDRSYPAAVMGLSDIIQVVGGSKHSLALGRDGTVWAWGRNEYANLGQGTTDEEPHMAPAQVPGLSGIVQLASGRDHVLALRDDGVVLGWGLNQNGQVGVGTSGVDADVLSPAEIALDGVVALIADGNYSFAVLDDGTAVGWGQNFNGQLGIGSDDTTERSAPSDPLLMTDVEEIDPGATHAVGVTNTGTVYTWGWSTNGSLGRADLLNNWAYPAPGLVTLP